MPKISRQQQQKIYIRGIAGKRPNIPLKYSVLRERAKEKLGQKEYAYIQGGAGSEGGMENNRRAFQEYSIQTPMLKGVSEVDLSIKLFGKEHVHPCLISPIGVLDLAHPKGDIEVAKAAKKTKTPFIISNQSSYSMEMVGKYAGRNWFQLYWSQSEDLVKNLIKRAEENGSEALVVTLDTTSLGWRPRDLELGSLPFLEGKGIGQYTSDPVFQKLMDDFVPDPSIAKPPINWYTLRTLIKQKSNYPGGLLKNIFSSRPSKAVRTFISTYSKPDLTWEDIQRLRDYTHLPIVLKGIHAVEDAKKAKSIGLDAILLSNHGGRQVDQAMSPLHVLPEIRNQLGENYTIIFDSGIRSGTDVMIALALGANAVCVGRPYVWALALDGEDGVEQLIYYYLSELELNMALAGIPSIGELNTSILRSLS